MNNTQRPPGRSGYDIRLDVLREASELAATKFHYECSLHKDNITAQKFTLLEDTLAYARELYKFVEDNKSKNS
jgi:hypothetical protein